jgi:hypothetical protein
MFRKECPHFCKKLNRLAVVRRHGLLTQLPDPLINRTNFHDAATIALPRPKGNTVTFVVLDDTVFAAGEGGTQKQ